MYNPTVETVIPVQILILSGLLKHIDLITVLYKTCHYYHSREQYVSGKKA